MGRTPRIRRKSALVYKPDLVERLRHNALGIAQCLFRIGGVAFLQVCLVADQPGKIIPNGLQMICNRLAYSNLEVPVATAGELRCDLIIALAGDAGIDGHQVVDAVLALPVAYLSVRIGYRPLELADNGILIVQDEDAGIGILIGLGHFLCRILQGHDSCSHIRNVRLRQGEQLTIALVEEGAQAIFVPNDSIIQDGVTTLANICKENKIPTYCASATTVASGCFATLAIDDYGIGEKAAEKAIQILEGTALTDVPAEVVGIDYCSINKTTMEALGLTEDAINTEYEVNVLE